MEEFAYDDDTEEDEYSEGEGYTEDEDDQVSDYIVPDVKYRREFMRLLGNIDQYVYIYLLALVYYSLAHTQL